MARLGTAAAQADLISAITYIRANAATFGINPNMIVIVGRDAGATAARYTNFDSGFNAPANGVVGIVSIAGNAPSPIAGMVSANTVMLHGEFDPLVPVATQTQTCTAATTNASSCSILTAQFGHDLDAASPAGIAYQTHLAVSTFG